MLHPRVSYLLGQGVQEQWLHVFLQLFATTWTQMVSEGKKKASCILMNLSNMILTTQEEMSFSSKARHQIEVGSWHKALLGRTMPYHTAKRSSFGQRKVLIF